MKKRALLLTLIPLLFPLERFCHKQTDGFALVNIASRDFNEKQPSEPLEVQDLLKQKFIYLDCGAQSYVFVSEDGGCILKFFKQQHLRIPPWMEGIWLPHKYALYRQEKMAKKRREKESLFASIEIANRYLKEETGLLFVHLHKSDDLNAEISLIDKIGIEHKINLDDYEFYLQKRATLSYNYIEKHPERATLAIESLVRLIKKRCQMQIRDKDPDFATNFGFIGDQAIQIDLGRFSLGTAPISSRDELVRITGQFRNWLKQRNPLWAQSLDENILERNGS